MNTLNKHEWYTKYWRIREDLIDYPHKDYEIHLLLADLWYTLAEMTFPKDFFTIIYRTIILERAIKLHKNCCNLD